MAGGRGDLPLGRSFPQVEEDMTPMGVPVLSQGGPGTDRSSRRAVMSTGGPMHTRAPRRRFPAAYLAGSCAALGAALLILGIARAMPGSGPAGGLGEEPAGSRAEARGGPRG